MQSVARELRVKHRFTAAYAPGASGTVEVVCRSVLSALRKLCSEFFIGIYAMADGATHCAKSIEFDSFYQTGRAIPVDCVYYAPGGNPRPDLFAEGSRRSDVLRDAARLAVFEYD
jgi:hypothetical protein